MWVSKQRFEELERRVQRLEQALSTRPSAGGFQPGADAWPTLPSDSGGMVPTSGGGAVPAGVVDHDALLALLRAGRKIEAIKEYRRMTGSGLAEAKDAVERMERMS